jgi:hypothetical protein
MEIIIVVSDFLGKIYLSLKDAIFFFLTTFIEEHILKIDILIANH